MKETSQSVGSVWGGFGPTPGCADSGFRIVRWTKRWRWKPLFHSGSLGKSWSISTTLDAASPVDVSVFIFHIHLTVGVPIKIDWFTSDFPGFFWIGCCTILAQTCLSSMPELVHIHLTVGVPIKIDWFTRFSWFRFNWMLHHFRADLFELNARARCKCMKCLRIANVFVVGVSVRKHFVCRTQTTYETKQLWDTSVAVRSNHGSLKVFKTRKGSGQRH